MARFAAGCRSHKRMCRGWKAAPTKPLLQSRSQLLQAVGDEAHYIRAHTHDTTDGLGQFPGTGFLSIPSVAGFVFFHLLHHDAAFFVRLGQAVQVTFQMGLNSSMMLTHRPDRPGTGGAR